MGEATKIEWCHHTFNPWIGCTRVSAACDHCYAESLSRRYGWATWGAGEPRKRTSEANWLKPIAWNKAAEKAGVRRRVFCASLADVFDAEVPDDWRDELFAYVVMACPALDFLLLTKRPQVAKKWVAEHGLPDNVWLGTTVENQAMADLRIPTLLSIPARVRFLSCEPLLEQVTLRTEWMGNLDWIIIGGESGPRCRYPNQEWFRSLVVQCQTAGIYAFVKQLGGHPNKRDRLEDFPPDLRVREFPLTARTGGG